MISIVLEGETLKKVKSHLKKYGPYYGAAGLVAAGLFAGRKAKTPTIVRTNVVDPELAKLRNMAKHDEIHAKQNLDNAKKDMEKMKNIRNGPKEFPPLEDKIPESMKNPDGSWG